MKKLKLISAIALASLTLFSCDNKDDDSSEASIEGKWKIHEVKRNNILQPLTDCEDQQTIEFTPTNFITTHYSGPNCENIDDVSSALYSLNGESLTIHYTTDDSEVITVKELTNSTLKLKVYAGTNVIEPTYKR